VFELATLTKVPVVRLNPKSVFVPTRPHQGYRALQFEFDCQMSTLYNIERNSTFDPTRWTTVGTTQATENTHLMVVPRW
jgi:hypothetical protein